jgi:AcrR family transcriptional regulator
VETRARIVEAAARLFVEQGYLGTTIEAIANAGGIAVQTVYYVFGTKRNVLSAVLDATIAGDVEPVPVLERPWIDRLADEPEAARALELLVDDAMAIVARTAPIYEVVRAAAADPEVGILLTDNRRHRRADQRRLVEMLAAAGHLRADLDLDTAADVLYALLNEEIFHLLVVECGWDLARFRSWLTALLVDELIDSRPRDGASAIATPSTSSSA